jgi:hypothetical protein
MYPGAANRLEGEHAGEEGKRGRGKEGKRAVPPE